jgi:hypothetical protein
VICADIDGLITLNAREHPDLKKPISELMRRYGIVRLKEVFPQEELTITITRLEKLIYDIDLYRKGERTEEELYAQYGKFNIQSYALGILKFEKVYDPSLTRFEDTALIALLEKYGVNDIFRHLASYRMYHGAAQIRITYPIERKLHQGGLRPHIEHFHFPTSHVMWMPMMPKNILSNRDAPGIGFMVREREEGETITTTLEKAEGFTDAYENWNTDKLTDANMPETYDDFRRYTPEVGAGDILLFDSMMPHFSFFPQNASRPRVSYDLRVMPATAQNLWKRLGQTVNIQPLDI